MVPCGDHVTESINHPCHCTHKLYEKNMQTLVMFKDRYSHCREIIEMAVSESLHVHFIDYFTTNVTTSSTRKWHYCKSLHNSGNLIIAIIIVQMVIIILQMELIIVKMVTITVPMVIIIMQMVMIIVQVLIIKVQMGMIIVQISNNNSANGTGARLTSYYYVF